MGMILNTMNDQATKSALDAAFTQHQLAKFRKHREKAGTIFGRNRHLSRIAERLEAFPPAVPRKWYGLLNYIHKTYVGTRNDILDTLQSAVGTPTVQSVKFCVANIASGQGYSISVDKSDSAHWVMTLMCPGDWNGPDDDPAPPHPDEGPPPDLGPNGP